MRQFGRTANKTQPRKSGGDGSYAMLSCTGRHSETRCGILVQRKLGCNRSARVPLALCGYRSGEHICRSIDPNTNILYIIHQIRDSVNRHLLLRKRFSRKNNPWKFGRLKTVILYKKVSYPNQCHSITPPLPKSTPHRNQIKPKILALKREARG